MSGWAPAAPAVDPSVKIPEGMAVAGMGRRIGAWFVDGILGGIVGLTFLFVAVIATGAVGLNQQALDQYNDYAYDPFADMTAPILNINMSTLIAVLAVYTAIMALYFIWPWLVWGASPGQKMLGLRVADTSTGGNLRIDQALLRWAVLTGWTQILGMVTIILMVDWLATTPTNDWLHFSRYGSATTTSFGPGGAYTLMSYGASLWPILLVIVTGVDKMKRGWHDKVSGSIVLGPIQYAAYPSYVYPGAAPAWPPQPAGAPPVAPGWPPQAPGAAPAWPPQPAGAPPVAPGWPPQAPGAAPAWPPQPAGAPPQAPGYPPSAYPGYPPSAYPGYPPQAYPGYPPQAYPGYPPAAQPPAEPPAAPADAPAPEAAPAKRPRKKAGS